MNSEQNQKQELIDEIKSLIVTNDTKSVEINPNYLEYFTLEELVDIKDELLEKKANQNQFVEQYVSELKEKLYE